MGFKCNVLIRNVLWYLVFTGTLVNFMIATNLNIAIVDMVKNRESETKNVSHRNDHFNTSSVLNGNITEKNYGKDIKNASYNINTENESKFDWNEQEQGMVLGAYFWLHWILQLPGGILAQRYGTKRVFGWSNVAMCFLACLIPISANTNYQTLIGIRVIQGFIGGLSWPALHSLTANWIPPNERSKFVTAYMGSSVGSALTFPLCGLIIHWFNWQAVFYVTGGLGIIWFIAWWLLVYDSPAQHPHITHAERTFIQDSLGQSIVKTKSPTPWRAIFLSVPMWMNILSQWGSTWSLFTLITQAPTYFKYIHGWGIRMTGLLSGIPHLCRIILAYILSIISDYLLRSEKMSRTGVRKIASTVCCVVHGFFMLGLAFSGYNATLAIICLTASVGTSGAVSSGPFASFVDLSPNYASILFGIGCTIADIPGFISPAIVGALTYQNQTPQQWQIVFLITTAMLLVPGFLYLCFASSELQSWNSPEVLDREMDKLNTNKSKENEEQLQDQSVTS